MAQEKIINTSIPSSLHEQKIGNDVFFYITRVTESNVGKWQGFAYKQHAIIEAQQYSISGDGITGFLPSLQYYNYLNTEVYVFYMSNKPIQDPNAVDESSIEMSCTLTTSNRAPFTSHMGIERSVLYEGIKHPNLSIQLHAIAAKFTLMMYPDKIYMINTPTPAMRQILLDHMLPREEQLTESIPGVYIGDNRNKEVVRRHHQLVQEYLWALTKYQEAKQAGKYSDTGLFRDVCESLLELQLSNQQCDDRESPIYITMSYVAGGSLSIEWVTIKEPNGSIACIMHKNHVEFQWFLEHPDQILSTIPPTWDEDSYAEAPVCTWDLKAIVLLGQDIPGEMVQIV